jgi:hypothetical protein
MNIAYANVCGLTQIKALELREEMQRCNIDILGIAETWEGKCQPTDIPGYAFISKPRAGGNGGGIGFYVSRTFTHIVRTHMDTELPEAMWLQIDSKRLGSPPLFLGMIYIPPSQLTTAALAAQTYRALSTDIIRFKQLGEVAILGDFNSRVGCADEPHTHIGQYGENVPADTAGKELKALLQLTDMYTLNGRTPNMVNGTHTPAYTRTRTLRTDDTVQVQQSILDYVLVPASWALPTPPAFAPRSTLQVLPINAISGTDHAMLWFRAPHPINRQKPQRLVQPRPNTHLLKLPNINNQPNPHIVKYTAALEETLADYAQTVTNLEQELASGNITAEDACKTAKSQLTTKIFKAVGKSIGFNTPRTTPCPHKPHVWTTEVKHAVKRKKAAANALASAAPEELLAAQEALANAQHSLKQKVAAARASHQTTLVQSVYACKEANDGKGMWAAMKAIAGTLKKSSGPAALKQPNSSGLITCDKDIADTLARHYEQVSTSHINNQGAGFDEQHKQRIETDVHNYRNTQSCAESDDTMSMPIDPEEVACQSHKLHNNRSPSPLDSVTNELLKYGGSALHNALALFFNLQFTQETKARTCGVITPIYKKNDPTEPANYRPITLGSAIDKLYNLVLNERLTTHLEQNNMLHDAQQGFRAGRSVIDNIFMLRTCIDARRQHKLDTYILFLDIEKAYDKVWRAGLLWHLWNKGVTGKMFRVLANMTDTTPCMVMHNGALSRAVHPDLGWEQGDTLATTMFNVFVDGVLQHVWEHHPGVPVPATSTASKLVALMYADDLAGLAATAPELQALIDHTRAALLKWRLKASVNHTDTSKTATMIIKGQKTRGRTPTQVAPHFTWGGATIPIVDMYKYLGVYITADGKWDTHMTKRTATATDSARAEAKVLGNMRLPIRLRKLTLTTVVQPALTHAAQVWARPTTTMRTRLNAWQMATAAQYLHCPATACHICLQQDLGLTPLHVTCETLAMRYWFHLQQISHDRLLYVVANAWTGKANPWQQSIRKIMQEYDVDIDEARQIPNRAAFQGYCAKKAMTYLAKYWEQPPQRLQGTTHEKYKEAFGIGLTASVRPRIRPYLLHLTEDQTATKGRAAELCMQLRVGCLPLKAMRTHIRTDESTHAHQTRLQCPACQQAPETPAHFLFECPAYSTTRAELFHTLQAKGRPSPTTGNLVPSVSRATTPILLEHFRELDGAQAWRTLMGPDFLEHEEATGAIADYIIAAWNARRAVLNGREANGGDPTA